MTEDDYNSMFDITRGVYFTLQQAAHYLADNGRIVSLSTSGTVMAIPTGGAYAGCKAAIEQFSAALAKELGARGITVNTVSPGVTETDGCSQTRVSPSVWTIFAAASSQAANFSAG